jgi:hypothetical protein
MMGYGFPKFLRKFRGVGGNFIETWVVETLEMSKGKWGKRLKHSPNPEFGKNAALARVHGENDGKDGSECGKSLGEVYEV